MSNTINSSVKKETRDFKLDRRSSKRMEFFLKVKFGIDDTVYPGKAYNISQEGILIHSFKAFVPNTSLNIKIYTDTEIVQLNTEVKRVKKTNDNSGSFMGLYFVGKNFEIKKLYLKELGLSQ